MLNARGHDVLAMFSDSAWLSRAGLTRPLFIASPPGCARLVATYANPLGHEKLRAKPHTTSPCCEAWHVLAQEMRTSAVPRE